MTQLPIEQEYSAVLAASVNYKRRAEAAEARAATAERQNEIYAAELDALAQRELRIRSERDEARLELQQIRTMLDNGIDETAIDMVTRLYATLYASQRTVDEVTSERDEARRQLEQAVAAERSRCIEIALDCFFDLTGTSTMSAPEVIKRTRHGIADAIRARSNDPH